MKSYPRARRLSALLREAVAPLVRESAPAESLATVRHVRLAPDFSAAFVHFTVAAGNAGEVAAELEKSAPRMRRRLASDLNLRTTPQLRFIPDEEGRAADRIRDFLEKVERETALAEKAEGAEKAGGVKGEG